MQTIRKIDNAPAKLEIIAAIAAAVIMVGSAASAHEPSYYIKKDTWQQTIYASRLALTEFESQRKSRQENHLKALGIKLGPWYSVGPFHGKGTDVYSTAFGPEVDTSLYKAYDNGRLRWVEKPDWEDGVVHRLPGDASSGEGLVVANYLFRNITAPKDLTLPVSLGSNDGLQVWFNQEKVLAQDVGRKAAPDQDVINLNFKRGVNKLLLKVNNRAAGHAFYFSMNPGGKTKAQLLQELWKLVKRDFTAKIQQCRMRWEREDKIWSRNFKPGRFQDLANRYVQAATAVETLAKQARQLARSVKNLDQLQKVREIYYLCRQYGEQITRVGDKMESMKNQFRYLAAKYKNTSAEWKDYAAKLKSLEQLTAPILARAKKGNSAALEKLSQVESDLKKTHESISPQIPSPPTGPRCFAFDLKQVRLLDGPFKRAMELDRKYLHDLDSDRLLHMFRITAHFPSSARPLGGWEKRELRGHTMGHYLSACAMIYASTGDEKLKAKAEAIVAELVKCQKSHGNGYLSAFPEEGIKRVIYGTGRWWAPWYTLHKIYAGLLDMYIHCGSNQALQIANNMADWAKGHLDTLTEEQTQRMLEVEYGGMNEVFCNLYAVTKNPDHLALALEFDHKRVFQPLSNFQDNLKGLHANTQIPKIIGTAREYELTGERYYYNIATFFWDQVVNARSYCTGGTSNHEHWRTDPYKLAGELSTASQETCCTYNMLKLTRHLFTWTPEAKYADYYERALYNSILSTQCPETGMMMYFVPLNPGHWKVFNTPYDSFWCCTGTGMENHAKYGDSIYFHDDNGVFVNLFIASEVNWPEKAILLRQETNFPEQQGTSLIIKTAEPVRLALRIRIPYWATKPVTVSINRSKQKVDTQPASYLTLDRIWKNGDRVDIDMPMSLHLHRIPDDENLAAVMYGPLVMAGALGTEGLPANEPYLKGQRDQSETPDYPPIPVFFTDSDDVNTWVKPVQGKPLTFRTVNAGRPRDVTLVPFYKLFRQRYAIYWRINRI